MPLKNARTTPIVAMGVITALLLCCSAARADYAVLLSGQRLHITGWQSLGETVQLDMDGGSVTLPASDLLSVEAEDIFPSNPQPPSTPKLDFPYPYAGQIKAAAAAHGVDPELVASVIAVESNFNTRAVSAKYALGLMQLRPETAARMAVRDVFDPAQNIDAGTRYLKELMGRYGQNLALVLAAYNAGPEKVEQYRGVPPFPETIEYVRRVTEKLRARKASAGQVSEPSPVR
jgi:soluble lytic murein transglycosylase-like protein